MNHEEQTALLERLIGQKYPPEEAEQIKANHRFDSWSEGGLRWATAELKAMPEYPTEASRELPDESYYRRDGKILLASCPFEAESRRVNTRVLREGHWELTVGFTRFLGPENQITREEALAEWERQRSARG